MSQVLQKVQEGPELSDQVAPRNWHVSQDVRGASGVVDTVSLGRGQRLLVLGPQDAVQSASRQPREDVSAFVSAISSFQTSRSMPCRLSFRDTLNLLGSWPLHLVRRFHDRISGGITKDQHPVWPSADSIMPSAAVS